MKRNIIEIDEDLCNGCGQCITGCAEGALELIDGKAKLVKEQYCDGLGACIGECPTGALKIVERDAEAFDEEAVEVHLRGRDVPAPATPPPAGGGCPGMQVRFQQGGGVPAQATPVQDGSGQVIRSELNQWPTQLHLVPVQAPFFKGRELVVLSTCSPSASPDVNWRYVRGRAIVIACPKLDRTEGYVEKLAGILRENDIPKVIVVRMEVPCCGGLSAMVNEAVRRSGRNDLQVEEAVIGLQGDLLRTNRLM